MVEKRKKVIAGMFNDLAQVYDLGNHLLSLGLDFLWRKRLAVELAKYRPESVLDLACGTADLAIAINKRNPEACIVGIDLAEKMLEVGARKILGRGLADKILLTAGDIEQMPFAEQSFSAATIAFGIRNVEQRAEGLSEIFRVLKPGGVFAVLEFSMPQKGLFSRFYDVYLGRLLPLIGKILSGEQSYFYLRDTIREFPNPAAFVNELKAAGFLVSTTIPLARGAVCLYIAQKSDPA
jgi:demethylmenaquinone methyltransferase/2-methoxy-6-polyprenyl-1,4-benzoquinol methylase